jgi:hypothetical protein
MLIGNAASIQCRDLLYIGSYKLPENECFTDSRSHGHADEKKLTSPENMASNDRQANFSASVEIQPDEPPGSIHVSPG